MIVHDIPQRSDQWFQLRATTPSASVFKSILTPTGKDSTSWSKLAMSLIASEIAPQEIEWAGNAATDRGEALEPEAREWLSRSMPGHTVAEVGFCTTDCGRLGCSPDGLIYEGDELVGGVEIKCKGRTAHVEMVIAGTLPDEHKAQVHGSMIVTGLDNWLFLAYHPLINPLILRVERDEYTAKLEAALWRFADYYREFREVNLGKLKPNHPDI